MFTSIFRFLAWRMLAALLACVPALAAAQTSTSPQVLSNNVAISGLDSSVQARYYVIPVPAGATRAVFSITGGPGDADLYVKYNAVPTVSVFDYRPYLGSSTETVPVSNPQAGSWYVMVRAYTAYSNVTLKASFEGGSTTPTPVPLAATPTLSPAPGTYSGQTSVRLATTTPNAVIRFTVNGTTPTTASEVYTAPIIVTSTTTVRAMAFANGYTNSAVAGGVYTIRDTLVMLSNGTAVTNLSGTQGSVANFKFAVPSGASSVTFSITGSTGDADLYVKYGQLATTTVFDQRPYLGSSNETVTINTPRAGDYYVMVHGYSAYSGLTVRASYVAGSTGGGGGTGSKPDLMVWGNAMSPRITTETFASGACEIEEGTIVAGTRKLLRFTTQSRNAGTADLVLGNPANNPAFEYATCHGHYHFRSFAQYKLLDSTGSVVRTGKKVGFCLMDITRFDTNANPSARYTCSNQGIQAGWADIYSSNLSGQWIDITGVPAGNYQLEVTMDPMNVVDELNESNNTTRIPVTIP